MNNYLFIQLSTQPIIWQEHNAYNFADTAQQLQLTFTPCNKTGKDVISVTLTMVVGTRQAGFRNCWSILELLISAVTASINTREPAIHAHTIRWGSMLLIMSSSFPSPHTHTHTSLLILLVQAALCLISPLDVVPELLKLFFLAIYNIVILLLRINNGLHLGINLLYLLWWSLLLTLRQTCLPSEGCSWYNQLLWRGFALPRPFGVPELSRAFFLFNNLPNKLFGHI